MVISLFCNRIERITASDAAIYSRIIRSHRHNKIQQDKTWKDIIPAT